MSCTRDSIRDGPSPASVSLSSFGVQGGPERLDGIVRKNAVAPALPHAMSS